MKKLFGAKMIKEFAILVATFIAIFTVSHSPYIALALSILVGALLWISKRSRDVKRAHEIQSASPEIIDHLISGIQSGLSLNESLIGLSVRGPLVTRVEFESFRENILDDGNFLKAIDMLKGNLATPSTDLIFEALVLSKFLGGAELLDILRTLGSFMRQDLALRKEIAVKHSWIRNSAHLSAAAPWLLLLLISTQPSTAKAFSQPSGISILAIGLALTTIAYLWMNRLSRLPDFPRVFK